MIRLFLEIGGSAVDDLKVGGLILKINFISVRIIF